MAKQPLLANMIWLYSVGRGKNYPYKLSKEFKEFEVKEPHKNQYYTLSAISKALDKLENEGWIIRNRRNTFRASLVPLLNECREIGFTKDKIEKFKDWVKKHHRIFNTTAIFLNRNKRLGILNSPGKDLLSIYLDFVTLKIREDTKQSIGKDFSKAPFGRMIRNLTKISFSEYKSMKKFKKNKKLFFTDTHKKFYKSIDDFIQDYEGMFEIDTTTN